MLANINALSAVIDFTAMANAEGLQAGYDHGTFVVNSGRKTASSSVRITNA